MKKNHYILTLVFVSIIFFSSTPLSLADTGSANGSTWADAVDSNSSTKNTGGAVNPNPGTGSVDGVVGQASAPGKTVTLSNPLDKKFNSVGALVEGFVEIFTYLVVIFAVIMIIWTGLQYILAGGNTEKMKKSSIKLGWLVVGVAVVIGARVIVHIVINTLQATGTVNQNVIQSANNAINNK